MHTQTYDPEDWITRAAAATRYAVSTRTLDRLADAGTIRRVRLPHRLPSVLLSVADLERAMAATPVPGGVTK